jgi:hypothetical protein
MKEKVKKETKVNINCCTGKHKDKASCGGAYFLGFLGAVIYFVQQIDGFWPGVLAFLKAFIWPVFVVYHLLGL